MTATAVQNNSAMQPMGEQTGVPAALSFPLAASAQAGKLQFVILDPTTGNGSLADDATPHQICGGYVFPDEVTSTSSTAGQAVARVSQRWATHSTPSTIANDGFTQADVGVPFWIADGNTPGKLSHSGGKDRSLGGLAFGVAQPGEDAVRIWAGPVAQLIARATLMTDTKVGGWYQVADAAAGTATTEIAIAREKLHGVITAVQFTGDGVTQDASDTATITISKRDGAGGGATSVATYNTTTGQNGTITANVPASFTLSAVAGALDLLETDILTITITKANSGKQLRGTVRVLQKVI